MFFSLLRLISLITRFISIENLTNGIQLITVSYFIVMMALLKKSTLPQLNHYMQNLSIFFNVLEERKNQLLMGFKHLEHFIWLI